MAKGKKGAKNPATRKPAKKAVKKAVKKPAAKLAKTAPRGRVGKPTGRRPRGAIVALGAVDLFGIRFRVVNPGPKVVRRDLQGDRRDKDDIRCTLGDTVRWSAPAKRPFRIRFSGVAPDTENPQQCDFTSRLLSGRQRVEVLLRGHKVGEKLVYDIFSPPDAHKPLDPDIIIEPPTQLALLV
jgi:hypothetical protein